MEKSEEAKKFEKQEELLLNLLSNSDRVREAIKEISLGQKMSMLTTSFTVQEVVRRIAKVKSYMHRKQMTAYPSREVYNAFPELTIKQLIALLKSYGLLMTDKTVPKHLSDHEEARCLIIDITGKQHVKK